MAHTLPDYPKGVTFEDVWAALMKTGERIDKIARMVEENGRQIGGLHNSFGELAEHLVAPGIVERFNDLGYHFDSFSNGPYIIFGDDKKMKTEIDILLVNDEYIFAIEVKSKPVERDIEHHLKRLEIAREHWGKHHDTRKIRGAIAGAVFPNDVKKAALEEGLYVLEQSGDTMKMDIPPDFIPKDW